MGIPLIAGVGRQKLPSWLLGLKFWDQKFHTKNCAHKMLMKLTPGYGVSNHRGLALARKRS